MFDILDSLSSAADALAAVIYSVLRLLGVPEQTAKKVSERLVIVLFVLVLIGALYSAFNYLWVH